MGDTIDLSLLTDGLEAEREQGITIDVAYRYFATPKRKFIIADTPGHEQYTRNMVTGASTADAVIILIDVSKVKLGEDGSVDLLIQTKRHSTIAHLLQIEHVMVAVNKMDLVDYDQAVYDRIVGAYQAFAQQLGLKDIRPIPLSALAGDNVVEAERQAGLVPGPDPDRAAGIADRLRRSRTTTRCASRCSWWRATTATRPMTSAATWAASRPARSASATS